MIKAILFDFNGVIINDEPIQLIAYQEVLKAEGITLTDAEYYSLLGMNDTFFVQTIFERAGKELAVEVMKSVIDRKSAAHSKMIEDELPLFPGVVNFVKTAARDFSLGVVSMARRQEIDGVLKRSSLTDHFKVVVSAEDVTTCKPDPACYKLGHQLLNEILRKEGNADIPSIECLVIEDAPPGIEAGCMAGMRTLGVTNTVSADALREAGAEVVTRSLADWTTDAINHVYNYR